MVMNKPVYISKQELDMFYQLRQGDKIMEKAPLGNNLRPRQPLNNRVVRTNIALQAQKVRCGKKMRILCLYLLTVVFYFT